LPGIFDFFKVASMPHQNQAGQALETENKSPKFSCLTNLLNFDATEHVNLFLC